MSETLDLSVIQDIIRKSTFPIRFQSTAEINKLGLYFYADKPIVTGAYTSFHVVTVDTVEAQQHALTRNISTRSNKLLVKRIDLARLKPANSQALLQESIKIYEYLSTHHANVLKLHLAVLIESTMYNFFDYQVDGSVHRLMRQQTLVGPVATELELLQWLKQTGSVCTYLHDNHICHR